MMNGTNLLKLDVKNISRDFILIILLPVPVFLALILRFGLPYLSQFISQWIDLYLYSPLILIFLIVMGPLLTGMVSGLMLVDEADEKIIPAIAVTPLGRKGYMFYRLTAPFVWTFLILLPVPFLSGLAGINYFFYIPIIFTASFGAPLEALLIAVLAKNKIEAMAMGKVTGILFIAPFIGWFSPAPWKFSAGILPSFWVSESYYNIEGGGALFPVYIAVGLLVHVFFIYLLLRKYNLRAS
jgi:fluoroquinolone transport system permease protein